MILKKLPIGTKVSEQQSSLVFLVAAHNHTAYTGTMLITDCAVRLASFDAAEPANPDAAIKESGNNFYPDSNVHRWLNADEVDWYKPSHEFDAPPVPENINRGRQDFYEVPFYAEEAKFTGDFSYKKEPGFLTWFSREFVDSICEVDVLCHDNAASGPTQHGPAEPFLARSKVFLPSAPEMGYEKDANGTEGFRLPLFNDARMRVVGLLPAAIGKPADYVYDNISIWYWLRTPAPGSSSSALVYNSDHKFGDYNPASTGQLPVNIINGIRPALNLESGTTVADTPDARGVYTLLFGGK
jgi:hypothetical protein